MEAQIRAVGRTQGGNGMKPIADRLHGMGLKLGLWMLRGVPVSAVQAKSQVLGGGSATADQARGGALPPPSRILPGSGSAALFLSFEPLAPLC